VASISFYAVEFSAVGFYAVGSYVVGSRGSGLAPVRAMDFMAGQRIELAPLSAIR